MNNRTLLLGGTALSFLIIALVLSIMESRTTPVRDIHQTDDAAPATTTVAIVEEATQLPTESLFELMTLIGDTVHTSPLVLTGRARGMWFFEGSFPIALYDGAGILIGTTHATAKTDWMTEEFVEFEATLTWDTASTTATSGVIIFRRDNPSGLPEYDASFETSINFN